MTNISVLMSVYHKDKPEYLNLAIKSIWNDQTLKPKEIIIVKDGPLNSELDYVINNYSLVAPINIISLPINSGLANALNEGLNKCSNEYIARMDADDISCPDRFEKQIGYLENNSDVDLVGGTISEINEEGNSSNKIVKYPIGINECKLFFSKRNPVAHPTVMFRRSFFNKVGWRYPTDFERNEDTRLWHEGYMHGCQISNISDVVLKYRVTDAMFAQRRNGKEFAKSQLRLRKMIRKDLHYGFSSLLYAYAMYYLMISPSWILKLAYKIFR